MNDEQPDAWNDDWTVSESSDPLHVDPPSPADELELELLSNAPQIPPEAVRRFCPTCGTVVDEFTGCCPRCQPAFDDVSPRRRPAGRDDDLPSIGSALGLYFAVLGTIMIGAIAMMNGGREASTTCAISVIMSVVILLWVIASWRTVGPALKTVPEAKWFVLAALMGGTTFVIAHTVVTVLADALKIEMLDEVGPMMDGGLTLPMIFLLLSVQPPIFEELAFRGIIQPAMKSYMTVRDAIIVSSLLFMVMHLMPLSFPHLFLIGICLGILRHKTGSLYPCIVLHFVHNTLVLLTNLPK